MRGCFVFLFDMNLGRFEPHLTASWIAAYKQPEDQALNAASKKSRELSDESVPGLKRPLLIKRCVCKVDCSLEPLKQRTTSNERAVGNDASRKRGQRWDSTGTEASSTECLERFEFQIRDVKNASRVNSCCFSEGRR